MRSNAKDPTWPVTAALIEVMRTAQTRGEAIDGDARELVRMLDNAIIGDAVLRALDHSAWDPPPPPSSVVHAMIELGPKAVTPVETNLRASTDKKMRRTE